MKKFFLSSIETSAKVGRISFALTIFFLATCQQALSFDEKSIKETVQDLVQNEKFDEAYVYLDNMGDLKDTELLHTQVLLAANGYGEFPCEERNKVIIELLTKAAKRGHEDSIKWLADAYKNGWHGLEVDFEKEALWRGILKK